MAAGLPTADPSRDPRAAELMAIDDASLSALIARFVEATRRASFASRGLTAAAGETRWDGDAADAFRTSIGRLPRRLDQVLNSYYGVRAALEAYRAEVDQLKDRWTRAVASLDQATMPVQAAAAELRRVTPAFEQAAARATRVLDDFEAARRVLCTEIDASAAHAITAGSVLGGLQARPGER
jgi:methyl-accepting chemotaxis protein